MRTAATACLVLAGLLPAAAAVEGQRVPHDIVVDGDYTLRFLEDPEVGFIDTLQVLKGEQLIYEGLFEAFLAMIEEPPGSEYGVLPLGLDVDATGDGRPDFVLQSYSGGAHCCYYTLVLEREPELAVLAEFDGANSPASLKNADDDLALEVHLRDWTFAYWKTSFDQSPAPEVILDLQDGAYVGSPELMRRPPPAQAALDLEIEAMRATLQQAKEPTPALWGRMLDYTYSGNAETAFALLDRAWPEGLSGKASFVLQFGAQLSFSPYWDTIAEMNGWTSTEP
ncbi:MAG TPA: hypothetical protein VJL84_07605 [Kiloniellales bacterium]|nr:hypothetical protein [Kiloniellales bacterium]